VARVDRLRGPGLNDRVLLERDELLLGLRNLLDEAAHGRGHLVFVAGEAGVGKTSLMAALSAAVEEAASPVRVLRGTCDNLTTPAALGPVLEALPEVLELVEGEHAVDRVALFRQIRDLLAATPTLLVLDDVHWADEATLDLLRYLGRRMEAQPVLVAATYRAEEVVPGHPVAVTLGDLTTSAAVVRMTVPPLTPAGVRLLAVDSGSSLDADQLFTRTGGNAFYVTELLAFGESQLPPTVRDAVLARVARLSPDARHVLAAAAILGQPAELALLVEVSDRPPAAVDECVASGLLVGDGRTWDFRHALARLAVADSLAPSAGALLHASALWALTATGNADDRRLTFHAAACGDHDAVRRHGPRAAEHAARLGAHRESAELYRLCLGAHPVGDPQRFELCSVLSYECYLTGELEQAHVARREALDLAEDPHDQGVTERWLSRLAWFLGSNEEAEAWAERAVGTLEPLGDDAELAMAYSNKAQLAMLADDVPGAVRWGERALELARLVGDRDVEIHALNNIGTALANQGDLAGQTRLEQSLDLAIAADAHEHAARAFTNLGATAVAWRRFAEADRQLRAGIGYCAERDLDSWDHYMTAWRARLLAEQGRLDQADDLARRLLARPHLPGVVRIPAMVVLAQVALRRGEDATALLAEVSELAFRTHESQRLVPVATAVAEAAWLAARIEDIPAALDAAWQAVMDRPQAWALGELAWWFAVAGTPRDAPEPVPEPFQLMLSGDWQEAADRWSDIGAPMWVALSLAQLPDLDSARRALEILDEIGAPVVRAAVLRDRRAAGLSLPRGPRSPRAEDHAGLTARELDVLVLLVEGLSNAGIAEALVLSPKTVGHHVSSVLTKLGEPTRARAAAAAVRRGIVTPAAT
jgi:DNA-binding CsgD family transcriptional regulator/tetratricopeptide (TPR) repeat protein